MNGGDALKSKPARYKQPTVWCLLLRIPELIIAALIAGLVTLLTLSVISRYALEIGLVWSDEAARFLFIWIVFVGFAVGVRHRAHIGVEWLVDRLPPRLRWAAGVFQDAAILLFSIFFTWQSVVVVRFSFVQRLPGMQISIVWLYLAVLVAGVLMTIYAAANLWERLHGCISHGDTVGGDAARHTD